MGKKGKEHDFRERQQIRWYQWEFLRRNPEYKRDYDEFMARFGPWFKTRGYWYQLQRGFANYSNRDLVFYHNNIWPALKNIGEKWCISDPFSSEWTFDSRGYYEYAPGRIVSLPTGFTSKKWPSSGIAGRSRSYLGMNAMRLPNDSGCGTLRQKKRKTGPVRRTGACSRSRSMLLALSES